MLHRGSLRMCESLHGFGESWREFAQLWSMHSACVPLRTQCVNLARQCPRLNIHTLTNTHTHLGDDIMMPINRVFYAKSLRPVERPSFMVFVDMYIKCIRLMLYSPIYLLYTYACRGHTCVYQRSHNDNLVIYLV